MTRGDCQPTQAERRGRRNEPQCRVWRGPFPGRRRWQDIKKRSALRGPKKRGKIWKSRGYFHQLQRVLNTHLNRGSEERTSSGEGEGKTRDHLANRGGVRRAIKENVRHVEKKSRGEAFRGR